MKNNQLMERVLRYLADLNGSDWIKGNDPGSIDMRQRSKNLQKAMFTELYLKESKMTTEWIELNDLQEIASLRQQLAASQNQNMMLREAIKAVEFDGDEVLDFDEFTAFMIPLDTYHALTEALAATADLEGLVMCEGAEMSSKWTGKEDAPDGFGQFEEDGPMIHFDSFKDYFYLLRLFDIRKDINFNAGRHVVLNAMRNYVGGIK